MTNRIVVSGGTQTAAPKQAGKTVGTLRAGAPEATKTTAKTPLQPERAHGTV